MTKEETIKVLQSIGDRAVDFPYMTACDWVAIAAAKRHLENSIDAKEVQELVSEDLEEASINYADNEEYGDDVYYAIKAAFKEGAKWQKEQLMKNAINTEASLTMSVPSICISLPLGVNVGDKVKVIVIKEE